MSQVRELILHVQLLFFSLFKILLWNSLTLHSLFCFAFLFLFLFLETITGHQLDVPRCINVESVHMSVIF